jgi:hypothetical protein
MGDINIISLIKDVGFPIAVSIYLLYAWKSQSQIYAERLDDIKGILVDMTTQMSYMISANINYRAGNTDIGDIMSRQAMYIGNKIKEDYDDNDKGGERK